MSRRFVIVIMSVLFAMLIGTLVINKPQSAIAQDTAKGTLEGTMVDSEDTPLIATPINQIELFLDGQSIGEYTVKSGGRYHIENLKKGLYQMVVTPAEADVRKRDRVKRYLGILIKPGKPLQLNVKLSKGQGVEQVGQDAVEYPPVIILSEMFENLQKQIDDLKKENEALKKQVEELKKK